MESVQTTNTSWTVLVQEDGKTKELFIEFPEGVLNQVGWSEGDDLEWIDNLNSSFTIRKKE
jgi:hypothetical protein|tara:strand:- start:566 stop:748 length:183 start_codon:yes stop_codon:yes gene_type:complete